jgi:hypothetical protein
VDDTRELIDLAVFHRALVLLAGLLLVGALAGGWRWGHRAGQRRAGLLRGLAVGLSGLVALGLWTVYNAVENRYGLDSVRALLINLAIFVVVGLAGGTALGWVWRRTGSGGKQKSESTGH